jgi:glycerophosphoryl diester phosphodiesterase
VGVRLTALLVAAAIGFPEPARPVEVIAHRGESADAPENTVAAFGLAWKRGADAIELDVHLSRDGQPVVIHDADTKRVAGAPGLKVVETPLAELRQLDAGAWKGPDWSGERMPVLAECLATVPDGKRCFIEIKVGPEAVPAVARAARDSGRRPEQLPIISFKADTVAAAKRLLPQHRAYLIARFKQDKETKIWSPTVDELIRQAKATHADGLDLSWDGPLTRDDVAKIKAAGLAFYVWTVDDPAVARRFVSWGADGVTTNKAGWMKRRLTPAPGGQP